MGFLRDVENKIKIRNSKLYYTFNARKYDTGRTRLKGMEFVVLFFEIFIINMEVRCNFVMCRESTYLLSLELL